MTTQTLTKALLKTFTKPDEVREFPKGRIEFVNLYEQTLARITLQPGWRWSVDLKPLAGTESCQSAHVQYIVSGRLMLETDEGQRLELKAGDAVEIPPGHDAWVLGDEPFVAIDLTGLREYAVKAPLPKK